jgi:hypothetical protein
MNDVGFIFTRCVRVKSQNALWNTCYRQIRHFFPKNPIIIIDDGSVSDLVKPWMDLTHTTIVSAKYANAGEGLPFLYLYEYKPFDKAVILHDSMFLQKRVCFEDIKDIGFLWDFSPLIDYPDLLKELQCHLTISDSIDSMIDLENWNGCFGCACVITYEFLHQLQRETGLLDVIPFIDSRPKRCVLERLLGFACCYVLGFLGPSLYGEIHDHPNRFQYTYDMYQKDLRKSFKRPIGMQIRKQKQVLSLPIIKVWNGR